VKRGRAKKKGRKRGRRLRLLLLLVLGVGAGVVGAKGWRDYTREARIARLRREADRLESRLRVLVAKDPVMAAAPAGDLLVGLPEREGQDVLGQLATGFLGEARLELRNLRVRKSGQVRTNTPFGRMTPGAYSLDLRIHEVHGVLQPRAPRVSLEGAAVAVELPVRVSRGEGRATLFFKWDSRGLAGAFCGDFSVRLPVAGKVVPRTYTARGRFDFSLEQGEVVATPVFPDLVFNLQVEPSEQTWRAVARVLADRGAGCRAALKLVDVPALLRRMLAKGFNVKVPPRVLKALRRPATVRRELTVEARTYALEASPRRLAAAPRFLWYAADVSLAAPRTAEATPSPPPASPPPAPAP
jgi:hypothetical protein